MTKELEAKIKELESQLQASQSQLETSQQEVTKWKYKFNLKNAEYILLYHELKEVKKPSMNKWIIIGGIVLVCALVYYYSKEKELPSNHPTLQGKGGEVFYDAQEEL